MTDSDTDTFWHLQFFSTVTFEFEVTHFVVLPNLQKELYMKVVPGQIKEDESIHHWNRETLAILDRSLATEKHKRIVLSMGGPRGSDHSGPSSPSHVGDWHASMWRH